MSNPKYLCTIWFRIPRICCHGTSASDGDLRDQLARGLSNRLEHMQDSALQNAIGLKVAWLRSVSAVVIRSASSNISRSQSWSTRLGSNCLGLDARAAPGTKARFCRQIDTDAEGRSEFPLYGGQGDE